MNSKQTESRLKAFLKHLDDRKEEDILSDAYHAKQSIAEVDVSSALSSVNKKIEHSQKVTLFYRIQRIAAILFIPLLATTIFLLLSRGPSTREIARETISNPSGVRSQVELPDGTFVWLNSGSEITYTNPFSTVERKVELSGEAYFDVTSDPKNPFIVMAGQVSVEVLGTKFNVKRYLDDTNIEVSLEEGKINLSADQGSRSQTILMTPGMRAVYDVRAAKTQFSREEDIHKYSAWHRGRLIFDDTPFPEVIKTLERWYSVEILIESDEVRRYKLTTTFEDQTIDQVIELLELSSPIRIDHSPIEIHDNGQIKSKPRLVIHKK
jgi:ferric-dicitrate binding protein FerR (iron transport regulator)